MTDRIFTVEEIREFSKTASEREAKRAEVVRTVAGRALLAASRTVVTRIDRGVITISDGDVLDAVRAIEAEMQEALG